MKKMFVMALVVLAMSVASCGHRSAESDAVVESDSVEVVTDTLDVVDVDADTTVVDSIVEEVVEL